LLRLDLHPESVAGHLRLATATRGGWELGGQLEATQQDWATAPAADVHADDLPRAPVGWLAGTLRRRVLGDTRVGLVLTGDVAVGDVPWSRTVHTERYSVGDDDFWGAHRVGPRTTSDDQRTGRTLAASLGMGGHGSVQVTQGVTLDLGTWLQLSPRVPGQRQAEQFCGTEHCSGTLESALGHVEIAPVLAPFMAWTVRVGELDVLWQGWLAGARLRTDTTAGGMSLALRWLL
jgi:hypothetical protein